MKQTRRGTTLLLSKCCRSRREPAKVFDDAQGSFFSSGDAEETIILGDFGRDLLNLPREPRGTDVKLTPDQASQLLGKYIVLRYHKREAGESAPLAGKTTKKGEADPDDVDSADGIKAEDAQSFNLVRKTLKLKIVGIVSSEPIAGCGKGGRPMFLPLTLAESLDMVQAGELWSTLRPQKRKLISP